MVFALDVHESHFGKNNNYLNILEHLRHHDIDPVSNSINAIRQGIQVEKNKFNILGYLFWGKILLDGLNRRRSNFRINTY